MCSGNGLGAADSRETARVALKTLIQKTKE